MADVKNKTNELNFFDLVKIFQKNKNVILIGSLVSCVITVIIVFFIMDLIYLSTGTIKTATKSAGLGGLLSGGIPDISDFGSLAGDLSPGAKELALYESVLMSRRCVEETILKFGLNNEWDFKYMYDADKYFRENIMEIKKDKVAGTMELGVYDKNPERAKEIADFLIYQLNKINVELNIQNAKNNRQFIEERYELVKNDLRKAEDSLKEYQDKFGVAPDVTIKVAVQSEIQLEAEIKSEEIKLELIRKILSPDQAEVKAQEEKVAALKNQLFEIQNSTEKPSNLSLKGAPDIAMNYLRLQRDLEIQNKILTFIIPLYEQVKIDEKKETPVLLILDPPSVPDKKVKPKRLTITLLSTILSFLLLFLFFVFKKKWELMKDIYSHS